MVTTHTLKYIHAHMCTQICGGGSSFPSQPVAISPREERGRRDDRKRCMCPMSTDGGRPPGDRLQ